ncbi:hypothetical protein [Pedobacter sp. MW01-1-1]|uniref:hypothetical protein n=1 Tax=Pedobacter sp. MW01-1-1 TaxID=3383027 RepID=UPI003FF0D926
MSTKIVLISSGQPSLNPRLVKEADSLTEAGYDVTVIYQYWNNWGTDLDEIMLPKKAWKAIRVGGSPKNNRLLYLFTRILYKTSSIIANILPVYFNDLAITRSAPFLTSAAKKNHACIYIAHNLGALPAAFKAAKKHNAKLGFDAEDFHRLETNALKDSKEYKLKSLIEDKYIPHTDYFTSSSPQISALYKALYPSINPKTILNVFPKKHLTKPITNIKKNTLRIFWFSQTIGPNRGLEILFEALNLIDSNYYQLTLLGDPQDSFLKSLNQNVKFKLHKPMNPLELLNFTSNFDIGIASESGFSVNNENALSNKIFNYLLCGLAIVASDTIAQNWLLNKYPKIGKIYSKNSAQELKNIILMYYANSELLAETKKMSFTLGQTVLNWEIESEKFVKIVTQTLENQA